MFDWNRFLKLLSIYLLVAFVISMCVVSILYITNPEAQQYKVVQVYDLPYQNITNDIRIITPEQYERLKFKNTMYQALVLLSIIGWIISSPDFKKGIKKLQEYFSDLK